ncbi:hypothetical protein [Mycolicibacterium sp. 624]|uniref:hypothetical protein n=1 Tax=Mycolicibacterium sp. 624 TaxID=3156314 RepID=UPI0033939BAA
MTSGVALIGASVIALSPIVVTPQQVHLPTIPVSSIATTLTASVDPISEWVQVLTTTFNNISALGQQVWANPAPILNQIIINQIGYANIISTALGAAGNSFVTTLTELPQALRHAAQELAAGQISGALTTAFQAMLNLVVNPGMALMQSPIFSIPGQVMQNLTNVVKMLPEVITGMGFSVLGTVGGVQRAFGDTAQAVYDGVRAGDLGAVVNAIVNAPAVLTNAFLNGYDPTMGSWGILTPITMGLGFFPTLVTLRDAIAQALGAPVPAATAAASPLAAKVADTGPSALPSAALSVATATLGAEQVAMPDATKTAATETTPAEAATTEPAETEPVATEPAEAEPETPATPSTGTTTDDATDETGSEASTGSDSGEIVRDSVKAIPGETGTKSGNPGEGLRKAIDSAGENLRSSLNKIGDGLKNGFGKPAESSKSDSDSASSGAGASSSSE